MVMLLWLMPAVMRAQADTGRTVTLGGFVDAYYAWDFGRPGSFDRSFFGGNTFGTQPARHNEFNVNLAFVEATLSEPRVRARLALQSGTSVQSNYAAEPSNGTVSGPSLAQLVQEAVVGLQLARNVWVDGGVFFSHLGMESWISRDNPTYTRSLVAEYSPYYQSGVKVSWTPRPSVTIRADVVNGWQNISENNSGKGAGVRVDYSPVTNLSVGYYDFFSNETDNRVRAFHGVGLRMTRGALTILGQADYGTQRLADGTTSSWHGMVGVVRARVSDAIAGSLRAERYHDRDQTIVLTGLPGSSLEASGGSVGVDVTPQPRVMWRNEVRGLWNAAPVFPNGATTAPTRFSGFMVSSLAVSF